MITKYLQMLEPEDLVANTVVGFLIKLIKENKNIMKLSHILFITRDKLHEFRDSNGLARVYNKNKKYSVFVALGLQKIFHKVDSPFDKKPRWTKITSDPVMNQYWSVNEVRA